MNRPHAWRSMRQSLGAAVLLSCLMAAGRTQAQQASESQPTVPQPAFSPVSEEEASRRAYSISRSVMSPFCPGRTLSGCPSPQAQEWREDIRRWSAEGVSAKAIRKRLAERAPGVDLAGQPQGAIGHLLPVLAVCLASAWLLFMWRRARPNKQPEPEPQPTAASAATADKQAVADKDALEHRLDAELERFDGIV